FIQIEIADAGIKPCVVPKVPQLEDVGIVKDDVFFSVGGVLFRKKEDAIRVASMDIYTEKYDWNIGYTHKWAEKAIELQIQEVAFYHQADCLRLAPVLQRIKVQKEEYEKDKSAYDKFLSSTTKHRDYVWGKIRDARTKEYEIQNAIDAINKYKEISAGDVEIALKFFNKAFTDENSEIKEIALKRLQLS
ncbi:MAG TPA: hypothetical protein VIY47_17225, partial [Ignavibacteriaceae bacterium]